MTTLPVLLAFAALFVNRPGAPHIKAAQAAYEEGKQAQADQQLSRAAECFQRAIEIEPTFLDAREALIRSYLDSSQRLEAAGAITRLLEINPELLSYRLLLGQILLEQKRAEKALAQFSLVLKREPYNAEGLLGFAAAAKQAGMKERANEAIERGRKRYPTDTRFERAAVTAEQ
ncbi:MAG: tetratricopeptide repeat protein [Bryobacterales bacterium]|nr:tetratricopeptide repeat protein [Bryobacterales bacterium]